MKLKNFFKLVLLVLVVGILISCGKKKEEKPLIMGLSPIANSEKMLEDWLKHWELELLILL